jgi:hypothetical protein
MWHIQQHVTPATLCLCSVPTENKGRHCGIGGKANYHHGGNARRQQTTKLVVSLVDGSKVTSTHMCDIHIDGLPLVLTGHIIPELSIASLFGIVVLTEAGCKVRFDKSACMV